MTIKETIVWLRDTHLIRDWITALELLWGIGGGLMIYWLSK